MPLKRSRSPPAFVFATVPSGGLFADLAELIAPQGRLALINGEAADVSVFMRNSVSVHYELMFTRPLFQTADIEAQHRLLNEIISKMMPIARWYIFGRASVGTPSAARAKSNRSASRGSRMGFVPAPAGRPR